MKICRVMLSFILAVAMTVTMMPWLGGAADRAYAETATASGGPVLSNSEDNVKDAFGSENVAVVSNGQSMTIKLQKDISLSAPVSFRIGTTGDTVTLDLNGHKITAASGNDGTDFGTTSGKNAIEIIAADYNVVIQGPGSIEGGKGAVYETGYHLKYGTDGGMAVCFTGNEDGTYWNPQDNDAELKYGLTVDGGAVLTGGAGADMTGDDWIDNIQNYSGGDRLSYLKCPQFKLNAGAGGAGIGQDGAGIEYGATILSYARIDLLHGTVIGGTGGSLNLGSDNTPALTHYGLMNHTAIDGYMQELSNASTAYDDYVESNIVFEAGRGGDGILIGAGRKFLCVEESGNVNGGVCGCVDYGKSKFINRIENKATDAGAGIGIYGDVGLKNVNATLTETDWSNKPKDSGDVGIYIAGTVKGGNAPDVAAMQEDASNGGTGIVLNGEEELFKREDGSSLTFPYGEDATNWGIIEVDTNGTVYGGNGGSAVYGSGGSGGEGIAETYTKGNDQNDDSPIGTDYYLIKGTVMGGNGGNSKFGLSAAGGDGISFANWRKNTVIRGSGTAIGGNQGDVIDRDDYNFEEDHAQAVRYYPEDRDYNNHTVVLNETAGEAGNARNADNSDLNVTASMNPASDPTSSTVLSCNVTKPAGYNGDVYIKWNVRFDDPLNGTETSDIEPSGTDSTSFNLRSNSQYKYLAYPTHENHPESGNNYNVNVATADRIVEAMGVNNTTATIWCDVLLSDGRWAKSNEITVGTGSDPGGGPTQEEIDQADNVLEMLFDLPGLGSLTLEHADAVAAVRAAYDALTPSQQEYLNETYNFLQDLQKMEVRIAQLQGEGDTAAAQNVENLITALTNPEQITLEDEAAVIAAREAYDKLTDSQKAKIPQGALDKLEAAEGKIDQLNQDAVEEAENQISGLLEGIKDVNLVSLNPDDPDDAAILSEAKDKIEQAVNIYNQLTDNQKDMVGSTVKEQLSDAVGQYNAAFLNTPIDDPTIEPVSITAGMITVANATYTGGALTPQVTVKDGSKVLKEGTDYTKAYSNNVSAGKGKVTVTGKGDYKDTATKEFTISPKAVTPSVTLSPVRYVWNGKVKTPAVTVKNGGASMATSQYSVSYAAGRKNVGTYATTAALHGNFSGSNSATFTIVPKGATIVKPVAAKKAITVKWKKQAAKMSKSRITGYQVQCCTNKKFKRGVKKKTVKGYKKTAVKISRLKSKKTYYVRVRTYMKTGGKTYYSNWSKVKAVKVK